MQTKYKIDYLDELNKHMFTVRTDRIKPDSIYNQTQRGFIFTDAKTKEEIFIPYHRILKVTVY